MFSLAHLSDPHLPLLLPLAPPPSARLSIKQRLAFLSWLRRRRHVSTLVPDAALLDDLASHAPDHLAVTGDLTNLGLPAEYEAARQWLERLGPVERVSVVPGNHDRTAPCPWQDTLGRWAPWTSSDSGGAPSPDAGFPFLKRRGGVALIGLSSAVPTRPGSAAGRLGVDQIGRAALLLDQARRESLFRVVLIHHPPLPGPGGRRKALRDRDALVAALAASGAELVLHGHHHVTSRGLLAGPAGEIPVMGVPAALAVVARPELAGWHLHRIEPDAAGWRLVTQARRYDPETRRFRACGSWTHRLARS